MKTSSNQLPLPRVALLGAGTMGAGMAQRLLEEGFPVTLWNRTAGPASALAEQGATAYAKPSEAVAAAEVVVTMLSNADAVADVMLPGATLDALRPGAIWAQMGTIGEPSEEEGHGNDHRRAGATAQSDRLQIQPKAFRETWRSPARPMRIHPCAPRSSLRSTFRIRRATGM